MPYDIFNLNTFFPLKAIFYYESKGFCHGDDFKINEKKTLYNYYYTTKSQLSALAKFKKCQFCLKKYIP